MVKILTAGERDGRVGVRWLADSSRLESGSSEKIPQHDTKAFS